MDELLSFSARNTDSHFIFNTLSAIEYLCRHDGEAAHTAVISFSSYLRGVIDLSRKFTLIPIRKELSIVNEYIKLINMRYNNRIILIVNGADTVCSIPPLTLLALVSNSFHHGVYKLEDTGFVHINITCIDNNFLIKVVDNGIGYNGQAFGEGLNDVSYRINKYLGGSLKINRNPDDVSGTTVSILFPINNEQTINADGYA